MNNHELIMSLQEQIKNETDYKKRFELSVELARAAGVREDRILKTKDEIDAFFVRRA